MMIGQLGLEKIDLIRLLIQQLSMLYYSDWENGETSQSLAANSNVVECNDSKKERNIC